MKTAQILGLGLGLAACGGVPEAQPTENYAQIANRTKDDGEAISSAVQIVNGCKRLIKDATQEPDDIRSIKPVEHGFTIQGYDASPQILNHTSPYATCTVERGESGVKISFARPFPWEDATHLDVLNVPNDIKQHTVEYHTITPCTHPKGCSQLLEPASASGNKTILKGVEEVLTMIDAL